MGIDYGYAEPKKKTMSITESFKLSLTPEPFKTLRKSGLTNGDDMLTSEGKDIFLTWLMKQNVEKFKTEVGDAIIADKESKKD